MKENLARLKRFARIYIAPRKYAFAGVQLLHVIAAGVLLAPPLLVRYVVDTAVPARDMWLVGACSASVVGLFGLFFAGAAAKEYWGHEVAQRITSRLRNDLYGHFQKLSMSFHDQRKAGGLLSRIVDDINVVQEVVHHGPEAIILAATLIPGTIVLMFMLNWKLALVVVAVLPILALYVRSMAGRMWAQFREVRQRKEDLSDALEENLSGIQIIKSFNAEEREFEAVERENSNHYHSRMRVIRYMALLFPGSLLINNLALAGILLAGGYMAISAMISVGTLMAFIMFLNYFLHPMMRMVMMMEHAGRFFASLERFFDYMDIEPDITDAPGAVELEEPGGRVAFEDVYFRYEDQTILKGITFTAEPGQMVALVGPSGAGKTTVTRLIPRFYEPYEGRVTIDGRDIRDYTVRSLRENIATVMQDDFLFSGTVALNIGYGRPSASREEIVEAAKMANADGFIAELPDGYDTEIGKRGIKLSEGQKQRISIARALLKNPQILLLDEATSSVDPETELLIQKALERLRKGRTTFAIAHRLSTIFMADQILFVQGGEIIESGRHQELIERGGQYARFFEIQFGQPTAMLQE